MNAESGRRHLSPEILHIVDNKGIGYEEMRPRQVLRIHAQDAVTKELSSFNLTVLSVRDLDPRRNTKTATFQYNEGDFNFYDGEDPKKTVQIKPGTLMENGESATLIPQADMRMVYVGGIGLGRDHSFEFVNGEDRSVIAHKVEMIDIGDGSSDFHQPDLSEHLEKVEATKRLRKSEREKWAQEVDRVIMADVDEWFKDHPDYQEIREMMAGFSPNGKLVMSSYLIYAVEDGVLDKAWGLLKQAHKEHFQYDPPPIRGDLDFKASNRAVYVGMLREAGIRWPRE